MTSFVSTALIILAGWCGETQPALSEPPVGPQEVLSDQALALERALIEQRRGSSRGVVNGLLGTARIPTQK